MTGISAFSLVIRFAARSLQKAYEAAIGETMSVRAVCLAALTALTALAAFGCGGNGVDRNHPPNVTVLYVNPENPEPDSLASIIYSALDVDGDPIHLSWSASAGKIGFDAELGKTVWHTPEEGWHQIALTASDGVSSVTKTIDVLVWKPREGNFYPLAVGNLWTYLDQDGNEVTIEIIDKIEVENADRFSYVMETRTTDPNVDENVSNYAYVGRVEGGIEQHGLNVIFGSSDTLLFDPWLPLYRFPLIPSKEWSQRFTAYLPDGIPIGTGIARYRVIEEAEVETPAGAFQHAVLVEEDFEWTLDGFKIDRTVSRKWLAPDVGIIRIDQTQTRGEQTEERRVQLTSYNLLPDTSME